MTSRIINSLKTSPNGRDSIKGHEGLRLKVYTDQAGHLTIGWGHKLRKHEIGKLRVITQEQAQILFDGDLATVEIYINGTARQPLNQNQFDAIASFAFNFGVGKLDGSTLWRHVQNGNFRLAAVEFDKWVYVSVPGTKAKVKNNGLINRRAAERALFQTPTEAAK